jgi:hypothetical protein
MRMIFRAVFRNIKSIQTGSPRNIRIRIGLLVSQRNRWEKRWDMEKRWFGRRSYYGEGILTWSVISLVADVDLILPTAATRPWIIPH